MKKSKNETKKSRYNIIDRGFYHHHQCAGGMNLKQYIITKEDGKKLLHLRFFNESDLSVSGMNVKLSQFTKDGELISSKSYSIQNIKVLPGSTYACRTAPVLEDECQSFVVDVTGLNSNGYKYAPVHGKLVPRFDVRRDTNTSNGDDGTVFIRKRKLGGGKISAFVAFILIIAFLAAYVYFSDRSFGSLFDTLDDGPYYDDEGPDNEYPDYYPYY